MLESLFRPLSLGPAELPNRIVSTSHQTNLVREHLPTADFVAYHEARARGGAGLIVLEATAVDPSGRLHPHSLAGYVDGIVDGYRRVAAAVRPHGTRLFVQLFHGGRERIESAPRPPVVAPSAIPSQRFKTEPRPLADEEIDALVAAYGAAAERAAAGGLDGVEISAAHNYLVAQFFTPALNKRTGRFAAGPAFLLAAVEAVRAAAPGIALGVRLSADSPAAQSIAGELAGRVDYLGLAMGESSTYRGSSGIVPPPTTAEGAVADLAESFRVGLPIVAATRIVDPVHADALIAEGRLDAVGMTRALITDPELASKARQGRADDVLRCIGCNACIAHYHAGTPIACAQNPCTGRELTLTRARPAASRLRVAVAGAGPAGLAAAAELLAAGHDVCVLERSQRLGGQIALAGSAPVHEETARSLVANYERLLRGADLRLGVEANAESVATLAPGRGRRRHGRSAVRTGATARRGDPGLGGAGRSASASGSCGGGGLGRRPIRACLRGPPRRSRARGQPRRRGGGRRRGDPPVPAQRVPRAALPGRCTHRAPPRARARLGRTGTLPQPVRARDRSRDPG